MNHLVLARKYRPKTFESVMGQEFVVSILKSAIKQNRIAHAMLFTGGRGVGKTTIARIVAKSLVCTSSEEKPCNECIQCQSVDDFSSLDVIEIDGASHTGVDDVREIRDSARYRPTSAKYKVFIIDEVHMLSQSAFNALLKILEEPPEHVVFIFATTESHKIPKTILSRCQRYDFKRSSNEIIFTNLKNILVKEIKSFDDDALRLIAKLADGSMRDALSMLEQILNIEAAHYTSKHVSDLLGVIDHQSIKDLTLAILDKDVGKGLLLIKSVYEQGMDICQLMDGVCERIRFLSLIANVHNEADLNNFLPEASAEDKEEAREYDAKDLKRCFSMALDSLSSVFSSKKPILALELFLLKIAQRADFMEAVDINYYLQKLDGIMLKRPVSALPLAKEPDLMANSEKKNSTPLQTLVTKPHLEQTDPIELFFTKVQEKMPSLMGHMRHAKAKLDLVNKKLILHFEKSLHYNQVQVAQSDVRLQELLAQTFGAGFQIQATQDESASIIFNGQMTPAQKEDEAEKIRQQKIYDDAANHPLVKKTLAILGGKIIGVEVNS